MKLKEFWENCRICEVDQIRIDAVSAWPASREYPEFALVYCEDGAHPR